MVNCGVSDTTNDTKYTGLAFPSQDTVETETPRRINTPIIIASKGGWAGVGSINMERGKTEMSESGIGGFKHGKSWDLASGHGGEGGGG